ncbi:hypothetical protein ABK040_002101 [Willaertia magna]
MDVTADYEVIELLGSGSFGKVFKIRSRKDSKLSVWKEIEYGRMSDKEKQLLVTEVNVIKELDHKHIVKYYDRVIDKAKKKIYIIMEYCEGGDLAQFIQSLRKTKQLIDEPTIFKIFSQICAGLKECHTRKNGKIIHRDLKPGNILLDKDYNVKLADFGLARILSEHSKFAHTKLGTPYYMSPEQINDQGYDESCDIWSLGCILYELCTLEPPFKAANQLALAKKILTGKYDPIPSQYSRELSDLIDRMLVVDHKKRITIEAICETTKVKYQLLDNFLQQKYKALKEKERSLDKREAYLKMKELKLEERERLIIEREKMLRLSPVSNTCSSPTGSTVALSPVEASNKENIFQNFRI